MLVGFSAYYIRWWEWKILYHIIIATDTFFCVQNLPRIDHVVRRSNRYWLGLPTDLIIEQVLMRNVKHVEE